MNNKLLKEKLKQAHDAVSELYGINYAETHPELIAACMNSLIIDELISQTSDIEKSIASLNESIISFNNNMSTIFEKKY